MIMTTLISGFDALAHHEPFMATLVDLGFKSIVILILGFLATSILTTMSASGKSLIWRMVFAALLALPFLQAFLPDLHIAVHSYDKPGGIENSNSTIFTGTINSDRLANSGLLLLTLAYTAISTLLVMHLLIKLSKVFSITDKAQLITDERILALLAKARDRNGINRPITALTSDSITSPVTWGFFRHHILFPTSVYHWDDVLIEQVIGHELGHIYRSDWVQQLLSQLMVCLYWPNPLILIASKKLALESEKACDDFAIEDTGCRIGYAENLLWLTQQLKAGFINSNFAPGFISARCILLERIRYILLEDKKQHHIDRESCLPRMLLAVLLVAPFSATSFNLVEHSLASNQKIYSIQYYPSNSIQSKNFEAELKSLTSNP